LSWSLNVVIDVAEENKADTRTDRHTVLKVVAVIRRVLSVARIEAIAFPKNELLSKSVEEVERECNQKDCHLKQHSPGFRLTLLFFLELRLHHDEVLGGHVVAFGLHALELVELVTLWFFAFE
jgi:hypothetical protein